MFEENMIHANFSVDDLEAAKVFYVDKFGFKVLKETADDLVLKAGGGSKVNIYYKADHRPWDSTVLGVEVEDVKAAIEALADAGVSAEKLDGTNEDGILHDPDKGDAAWLKDPAGNWVCISNFI